MCTRYYFEAKTNEMEEIVAEVTKSPLAMRFVRAGSPVLIPGEIRPTQVVPVAAPGKNGQKAAFPMRWGFQIPGRPILVNTRTETASVKPTFREAWERHRCAVPALWYYEWEHFVGNNGQKKTGSKYLIQQRGAEMIWLAGLYRIEEGFPCFTILTREPSEELKRIHDRMPLILPSEKMEQWITPDTRPEEILPYAVTDMVMEKAP